MGALAGGLGGGGGASVSASSSASSGPLAGTTGSLVLNFGGINLGNQDIPLNAESASPANAPPVVGTPPTGYALNALGGAGGGSSSILILLLGVAAVAAFFILRHKK